MLQFLLFSKQGAGNPRPTAAKMPPTYNQTAHGIAGDARLCHEHAVYVRCKEFGATVGSRGLWEAKLREPVGKLACIRLCRCI